MVDVIPAIIPRSLEHLTQTLGRLRGLVPLVQLDLVDGSYAKPPSWPYVDSGPDDFKRIAAREIPLPFADEFEFEIDLMVSEPEGVIEEWMHAGARRLIVHVGSTKKMENIIQDIAAHVTRGEGEAFEVVSLGIAIAITTPTESIEKYISDVEFVQCMGIAEVGKQGQPFDERVLSQLSQLRARHPELILSVDGSVNRETAPRLVEAGANRLVIGSALLEADAIKEEIEYFKSIA